MIMSDVFATVFIILGIMLMLVGYWLTSQSLFPAMVEGTAERYRRSPVASVLVGILLLIPFAVVSGVIGAIPNPALKLTSVGISALYLMIGLFGSAGLAYRVGAGLSKETDAAVWQRTLRGGFVLTFTFLLPIIGQIALLFYLPISGVGAWFLYMLRDRKKTASPPAIPMDQPQPTAS